MKPPSRHDRADFQSYVRQLTARQVEAVIERERSANRRVYMKIAMEELERRRQEGFKDFSRQMDDMFFKNASAIGIPHPDDNEVLRNVNLGDTGYRLMLWETGRRDNLGKDILGYAFYAPDEDEPLFAGEDFGSSPMHAIDSDETLRSLLGFLTLRPGDTDREYFESYTPEQRAFAEGDAEELQMWAMEDTDDDYEFVDAEALSKSITEDPEAGDEIRAFAEELFPDTDFDSAAEGSVTFEHGQWYISVWSDEEDRERTFSVVETGTDKLDVEEL